MIVTIKKLLSDTKRIVKHQNELAKLKGENFNVFSILKMESKENETHSAFLGELLNPKGSHEKGNTFLKLFLKEIGNETIQDETAMVYLEYYIGNRDDENKTGGRVDIFIEDKLKNSICIENKIYAPDQNVQIQRYVNYKNESNYVYYLTLKGEEASEGSQGDLKAEEDYFCISYNHIIVNWLEQCLKESADQPILRETVKQYIILIKKLTNQLSNNIMEKEIEKLIKDNYSAAKTIEGSISEVELQSANVLLQEMKSFIDNEFSDEWKVTVDENLNKSWTGLNIAHKNWNDGIRIALQGQSKVPWNDSVYGIIAYKKEWDREDIKSKLKHIDFLQNGYRETEYWPCFQTVLWLNSPKKREILFDKEQRKQLVKEVSEKLIELAKACEIPLADIKKI